MYIHNIQFQSGGLKMYRNLWDTELGRNISFVSVKASTYIMASSWW